MEEEEQKRKKMALIIDYLESDKLDKMLEILHIASEEE